MSKKQKNPPRAKGKAKPFWRRQSLRLGFVLLAILVVWAVVAEWYVHHPRQWLNETVANWPTVATAPLLWLGNPVGEFSDALGWTGEDVVYEYDTQAPSGSVFFAGAPKRVGLPAPDDIRLIDRGNFVIGWSDKLRHPVWVAYHVTREARYPNLRRPGFTLDRTLAAAPRPDDYRKSGYDRGHMAPNYAIVTRYGEEAQKKTFKMSNVAPQSPALNRGVWRDVEHRIADLWTARYGEIWVVVGAVSCVRNGETLPGTDIDVPYAYYQVILAQEGLDVRAMALYFKQRISWYEWPTRNLISIDELEEKTGLDFNPELPSFIQDPLEAQLPTRLWPIRVQDIFRLFLIRFQ